MFKNQITSWCKYINFAKFLKFIKMGESPHGEDTYQQFIQNDFEYKAELINFYNSISTSCNEQNAIFTRNRIRPKYSLI